MPKICPVCETVYPDANAFCPVDGTTLHVVDLDGGLIGSVVADRYLVTDLLGEGGMGKVYKARHVRLPQQAAIKVLRKDMVRDPAAVARFNREASNASRIDDEHVARVFDFGETDGGTVYLAMEFVAGRTLRDIITKGGAIEPVRAAELVRQIARGLDAAHRLKIIHRDLKPDNILVIEGEDGRDRVKVVDFGIAKAFGADEGQLTRTGFIVGTPEFMSPEQLMGEQLDARSDVYALALVAFQCLTAALPFGGDTPEQAMTGRLMKAPKRLDEVSSRAWPQALQEVFDAALSREVDKRPASAGEFARRLGEAIAGGVPAAAAGSAAAPSREAPRPSSAATRVIAPNEGGEGNAKKRSLFAPAIAAVVVVGIAGGLVYFLRASDDPRTSELAADEAMARSGMPVDSASPVAGPTSDTTTAAPRDTARSVAAALPPTPSAPAPAPKGGDRGAATKGAVSASTTDTTPARPEPPRVNPDDALRVTLDSLSAAVAVRGVDAAAARRLATALRDLAPRLSDPALKARAYFRLIDASALSGDLDGACAALRGAKANARGAQLADVRRYEGQLGCS